MSGDKGWDVVKFEANLQKKVRQRQGFLEEAPRTILDVFLVDQFLVVGTPPAGGKEPKILFAYPPFEIHGIPVNEVCDYCIPTGPKRVFLEKTRDSVIQDEFIFRFTGERRIYGVCVHIRPSCGSSRGSVNARRPFFASKETEDDTFCFCILTSIPAFSAHTAFARYLALWACGVVREPTTFKQVEKLEMQTGTPIKGLDLAHQYGVLPGIQIPVQFVTELATYFKLSITAPPIEYGVDLVRRFPPMSAIESERSILWAGMDTLFSVLTPAEVVTVFGALMQDAQILVIGKCLHELTYAIQTLATLMKPLTFTGQVIPLLPESRDRLEILGSPTPYIIGCPPFGALNDIEYMDTQMIVDLVKKTVRPARFDYPRFPMFDSIVQQLTDALRKYRITNAPSAYGFPRGYAPYLCEGVLSRQRPIYSEELTDAVCAILRSPFNNAYSDYLDCFFVTDTSLSSNGVTLFNQELFLGQVDRADLPFYTMLMESQSFQEYIEDRIVVYMQEKGEKRTKTESKLGRKNSFSSMSSLARFQRLKERKRKKSIVMAGRGGH